MTSNIIQVGSVPKTNKGVFLNQNSKINNYSLLNGSAKDLIGEHSEKVGTFGKNDKDAIKSV